MRASYPLALPSPVRPQPPSLTPATRRDRLRVGLAVATLLVVGGVLMPSTGHDDKFLTFWPAWTLAHHGDLVNATGDRVEQSSSLAMVLLLGALGRVLPVEIATLGWLVSIAAGAATVLVTYALGRRVHPETAEAAALLVGTSSVVTCWTFSGMETTLASLATAWLLLGLLGALEGVRGPRALGSLGGALALALTVRPEAVFTVGILLAGAGVVAWSAPGRDPGAGPPARARLTRLAVPALLTAGIAGALLAFRQAWFSAWFPQPVAAKAGDASVLKLVAGLVYLPRSLDQDVLILFTLAAAAIGGLTSRLLRRQPFLVGDGLAASAVVAGVTFAVLAGGDWMPGARFLVPVVPAAAVLAARWTWEALGPARARPALAVLAALGVAFGSLPLAMSDSPSTPLSNLFRRREVRFHGGAAVSLADPALTLPEALNREHLRDVPTARALVGIVDRLRAGRTGRVTVVSGQAGMVLYHLARTHYGGVRFVDRTGLSDRVLTGCPATRAMPRYTAGLLVPYESLLDPADPFAACGVGRPDVVFDLEDDLAPPGDRLGARIEERGYDVVYRQAGDVAVSTGLLRGARVPGGQIIAVRDDLTPLLGR